MTSDPTTSRAAFWVSALSFAVYNGIAGYLVVRRVEEGPLPEAALFAVALGLHFVINDLGLRHHHRRRYDRYGRPLLVTGVLIGWGLGVTAEISEAALGMVTAFLAGGIILNVVKEEVPRERQSRFTPLALAAAAYAAVLLAV